MLKIAYYVSSHGFGHAAREQAVIERFAQDGVQVYVRSAAPAKFFRKAHAHHVQAYDVGMKQIDALHFDIPASFQAYAEVLAQKEALLRQEVAFIQTTGIHAVVADMPPLACDIAEQAGVPSIVTTHFTWDWVYEHYSADFPQYQWIIDAIRASYGKATLALQFQLPLPHPFPMFPRVEKVGLVYNALSAPRAEVRTQFGVAEGERVALITMGGHTWEAGDIRALKAKRDWHFWVMPSLWPQVADQAERFHVIPTEYPDYHNVIAHADVVVGKAGGSTVAEVLGHQTPMIYTTQHHWRESALLAKTLDDYAVAQYIPVADFSRGAWVDALDDLLACPAHWPSIPKNGVEQVCQSIYTLIQTVS